MDILPEDELWCISNVTIMSVGALYCFIILILLLYHYATDDKSRKHQRLLIAITIIHTSSWLIHFASSTTTYIQHDDNRDDAHDLANYLISCMIIVHPIAFYSLVILRIHFAFGNTVYGLGRIECLFTGFGVFIVIMANAIEQICWMLIVHGNAPIIPVDQIIIYLWIGISFDIVTRLCIVMLFISKLYRIFVLTDTPEANLSSALSPKSFQWSATQIEFLCAIRKIALLGIISILPLTLSRIAFVLDFVAKRGHLNHQDWIAFNATQMIAVFIEILALFLIFKFNERGYLILCKCCDTACRRCCNAEIKRRILPPKMMGKMVEIASRSSPETSKFSPPTSVSAVTVKSEGAEMKVASVGE